MNESPHYQSIKPFIKNSSLETLNRAERFSLELISNAQSTIDSFLTEKPFPLEQICIVAVGSVGRIEALQASDIDVLPILDSNEVLAKYCDFDKELRERLRDSLSIKVSKGDELTKPICIDEISSPQGIGGNEDSVPSLTKRILVLTESMRVGGKLSLNKVRDKILCAYANEDRTSGRHVLSLCNDIARYYRTLCIDYKNKVDHDNNWCARNLKLRHSRKFWYFSNMAAIAALADKHPNGDSEYAKAILELLESPPAIRLFSAIESDKASDFARLLESYTCFLEFMSCSENREALGIIKHEERYKNQLNNPFPAMKYNSDLLHQYIVATLEAMGSTTRRRVLDWFLL